MNVDYRQIAKVLVSGMPLEGQEYSSKVEEYIKVIETMPVKHQQALRASYIFGSMAPAEERQDLFQDLVDHVLTKLAKRNGQVKDLEAFCYTVAKHKWGDWWRQKKRRRQILNGGFISLDERLENGDREEIELHKLIPGEAGFQDRINSKLDSLAVLNTLPDRVKAIVLKRLDYKKPKNGNKVSSSECNTLWRYARQNEKRIRALLS